MTQMLGSKWAMPAFQRGDDPCTIQQRWQDELRAWRQTQERYRLYRDGPPGDGDANTPAPRHPARGCVWR
jgi:hypothetical protein